MDKECWTFNFSMTSSGENKQVRSSSAGMTWLKLILSLVSQNSPKCLQDSQSPTDCSEDRSQLPATAFTENDDTKTIIKRARTDSSWWETSLITSGFRLTWGSCFLCQKHLRAVVNKSRNLQSLNHAIYETILYVHQALLKINDNHLKQTKDHSKTC